MGWDFTHREKGTSNADWLGANLGEGYTLLDSATVGGTWYAAVRRPDGLVEAFVTMTKWAPRDYFNFGKKDMTESWGPTEARCPDRILDLLSPTELLYGVPSYVTQCNRHNRCAEHADEEHVNQHLGGDNGSAWAHDWRMACRSYNRRVGAVKRGTTILHAGSKYTCVDLRRNLFRADGVTYRFPHWRTVQFEVLPA